MTSDTKTALLNAAEQAAREHGHSGFSYADLSAAVGIRKASIHHHFPTKAHLLTALMRRYGMNFQAALKELDRRHRRAGTRLRGFLQLHRDALQQGSSQCLCIALSTGRDQLDESTLEEIRGFRRLCREWLADVFESARADGSISDVGRSTAEADQALAIAEGAQVAARAECDMRRFDKAVRQLKSRIH